MVPVQRGERQDTSPGEAPRPGHCARRSPPNRPHGSHTFGLGRVGQTLGRIFQRREEGGEPETSSGSTPDFQGSRGAGTRLRSRPATASLSRIPAGRGGPSGSWFLPSPQGRGKGAQPASTSGDRPGRPSESACPRRGIVSGFLTNPTGGVWRNPPCLDCTQGRGNRAQELPGLPLIRIRPSGDRFFGCCSPAVRATFSGLAPLERSRRDLSNEPGPEALRPS